MPKRNTMKPAQYLIDRLRDVGLSAEPGVMQGLPVMHLVLIGAPDQADSPTRWIEITTEEVSLRDCRIRRARNGSCRIDRPLK